MSRTYDLPTVDGSAMVRLGNHFLQHDREISAMNLFQKTRIVVPMEVAIVIAINVVLAVFGYYLIMTWALFRG